MDRGDNYKKEQDAMFQELQAREQLSERLKKEHREALRKDFEPIVNRAAKLFHWYEPKRRSELDEYVRIHSSDE